MLAPSQLAMRYQTTQNKMKEQIPDEKPHVLVVPYPAQGHVNPALAFAKCLASKGVQVTVVSTPKVTKSGNLSIPTSVLTIRTISDGSEEVKEQESIEGYFQRFRAVFSDNITKFIDEATSVPKIVIYDSTMPWILDIVHERGLLGASFFTQACAVNAIYYYLHQGLMKFPYEDVTVSLPSMPQLELQDLPYFGEFDDPKHTVMHLLADQFSNIEKVDWIFFNTFQKLEDEVLEWMASKWPIKTIGPTFALEWTDEKMSSSKNHMISLFETNYETCTEWLNSKETGSVIYVSFGSVATLTKEQMEEVACGLQMTNSQFLWVVRASEEDKLPPNFISLALGRGSLVVRWCNQPEVLAHHAVSCFMTHCGWNSTLEALCFGFPLIAMGRWVDQQTNAKFIEDVWRVGVRVRVSEDGVVGREEITRCVEEVTQGEKAKGLKRNAGKWKDLANEAVAIGGSSADNIEIFISKIQFS